MFKKWEKIYLTRDCVTAVYSDPRTLIVRCRATKVDFYIISAHAPYVISPTNCSKACEWWVIFLNIVSNTCISSIPVLIGIDANYVVHADASSGVGDVYRLGELSPQHQSVCELLNNLNVSILILSSVTLGMSS